MSFKRNAMIGAAAALFFAGGAFAQDDARDYSSVTTEMLENPAPEDWLMWRRTYDTTGYSPLDQINKDNVEYLQLAWAWTLAPGMQEPTPIVHDGVMFVAQEGGAVLHALDAATGDLIWEYRRGNPERIYEQAAAVDASAVRTVSLYGDNVYLATGDAAVVALDAATGQVVWETAAANWEDGYYISGGTMIIDGKVITGTVGCFPLSAERCAIVAHDADNGEELWRTYTVPGSGDEGGDTWDDLPLESRRGGTAWIAPSYDPELNLIYIGTGQPYPWSRISRGSDGDNLYTNSTLALDPATGEVVWYFQYVPGDDWDLDEAYEHVLVDAEIDGEERKLLLTAGKRGILYTLDRTNGEFVRFQETVYQNTITVDPETGEGIPNEELFATLDGPKLVCPYALGGKDWQTMAYSPLTDTIYMPVNHTCQDIVAVEIVPDQEGIQTGASFRVRPSPETDQIGQIDAFNVSTGEQVWQQQQRAAWTGSMMATGGGLVFASDINRRLVAFDDETGEVLWETRLNAPQTGYPTTYSVDGQQFIAVPVGKPGHLDGLAALTPEIRVPAGGSTLLVFSLPESVR